MFFSCKSVLPRSCIIRELVHTQTLWPSRVVSVGSLVIPDLGLSLVHSRVLESSRVDHLGCIGFSRSALSLSLSLYCALHILEPTRVTNLDTGDGVRNSILHYPSHLVRHREAMDEGLKILSGARRGSQPGYAIDP